MRLNRSLRASVLALAAMAAAQVTFAQANSSAPPKEMPSAPSTPNLQAPPAEGASANPFPKVDPKNFTADKPSVETVNEFLRQSWGYDANRIWQVAAIMKTPVEGVTKVVVQVAEKGSQQPQTAVLQFFALPDGKHIISDDVLPFGPHPFAENRAVLLQRASGPSRGGASKDLLIVEFADFQCPHCKDAQTNVDKLLQEYPNAHFIFENFPLVQIHNEAYKAAAYSVCAAKLGGNDAFFKFAAATFDGQAGLTPEGAELTLKGAASKVGLDPAKIAACAETPEAKASVDASLKLGQDLNVNQTPMLYINGRSIPGNAPYNVLKQIVDFQMKEDGPAAQK
jgi:protein-disulfide isomerase